jgi:transposase
MACTIAYTRPSTAGGATAQLSPWPSPGPRRRPAQHTYYSLLISRTRQATGFISASATDRSRTTKSCSPDLVDADRQKALGTGVPVAYRGGCGRAPEARSGWPSRTPAPQGCPKRLVGRLRTAHRLPLDSHSVRSALRGCGKPHVRSNHRRLRPKRRHFTAEYKLRVVEEYDAAPSGEKGAILRREGLYDSSIQLWRRQRDDGALQGLSGNKPAADEQAANQRARDKAERVKLERENARLKKKLAQTEAALEIVGKWHALLEMMSESADSENS